MIQLRLGNLFYSNMQLKSHLQFCRKRYIRNANRAETYLTDVCKWCLCLGQSLKRKLDKY